MSKIKFKIKLTGLEIEFEGTNEQMKEVSGNLSNQISALIQPTINSSDLKHQIQDVKDLNEADGIPKQRKQRKPKNNGGKTDKAQAIDFQNDINTYGAPIQSWTAFEKAIWLLYVVEAQKGITELTAAEVAETFNKHYKQQGTIRSNNVSRDFGNKKGGASALVGENTTVYPAKWYLTDAGKNAAIKLITDLKANGAN